MTCPSFPSVTDARDAEQLSRNKVTHILSVHDSARPMLEVRTCAGVQGTPVCSCGCCCAQGTTSTTCLWNVEDVLFPFSPATFPAWLSWLCTKDKLMLHWFPSGFKGLFRTISFLSTLSPILESKRIWAAHFLVVFPHLSSICTICIWE